MKNISINFNKNINFNKQNNNAAPYAIAAIANYEQAEQYIKVPI